MKEINNEKYWEFSPVNENTTDDQSYVKSYSDKCYIVHVVYKSGKSYNHYVPKSVCRRSEDGKILVPEWALNRKNVKKASDNCESK